MHAPAEQINTPPPYTPAEPSGATALQHSFPQQQVLQTAPAVTTSVTPQHFYSQQQIPMASTGLTFPQVMTTKAPPVTAQPLDVSNVVLLTQTTAFGADPAIVTCPSCHQNVRTKIKKTAKAEAWVWSSMLCILGCQLCCWIPFVIDSCYEVKHTCPNCRTTIASGI